MKGNQTGRKAAKEQENARRMLRSMMFGMLTGAISAFLLMLLGAWIVSRFHVPVTALRTISAVCFALCGMCTGLTAGLLARKKGLLIGLICGVIWLLIFAIGNLIGFKLHFELLTIIKAISCLLLCAFGGSIGASAAQKKEKRRYTY